MSSYEHIMDTLKHKQCVLQACSKLIKYLYDTNQQNVALELAKRCSVHDNSKFEYPEFDLFSQLCSNKDTLKDPTKQIDHDIENVIKIHWMNNSHHPEYYKSYKSMSQLDVLEMVCDWYARSIQYNTDFLEFVNVRQKNRFHFDDEFFKKVYEYCEVLAQDDIKI